MTNLSDEAKRLRLEILRLRPGRARRYAPALQRRILAWVERARATGMLEIDCGNALGIPQSRFGMWRESGPREVQEVTTTTEPVSLVPIEVPAREPASIQIGLGLAFVSPHGYRVEGLTFEQAFAMLKEFE